MGKRGLSLACEGNRECAVILGLVVQSHVVALGLRRFDIFLVQVVGSIALRTVWSLASTVGDMQWLQGPSESSVMLSCPWLGIGAGSSGG